MKRRNVPNTSYADATVHLTLLLLVTASLSFLEHCVARRVQNYMENNMEKL